MTRKEYHISRLQRAPPVARWRGLGLEVSEHGVYRLLEQVHRAHPGLGGQAGQLGRAGKLEQAGVRVPGVNVWSYQAVLMVIVAPVGVLQRHGVVDHDQLGLGDEAPEVRAAGEQHRPQHLGSNLRQHAARHHAGRAHSLGYIGYTAALSTTHY